MMISLTDTLAGDRGRVGRTGGAVLAGIDRTTLRLADIVLCDTRANADFMAARFGVPPSRLVVAPVGAEPDAFPPSPQPDGPVHVLWYGKLSPMHGLDTIVNAARRPGVPPIRLVGSGQLDDWLADEMRRDPPQALTHVPWVPYDGLAREVAASAVVLGVFGLSDKASRVVPNKVFQAMAAARPVVTADTPGIREALVHGESGWLVPAGDADALAEALRTLAADPSLRAALGGPGRGAGTGVAVPVGARVRGHPGRAAPPGTAGARHGGCLGQVAAGPVRARQPVDGGGARRDGAGAWRAAHGDAGGHHVRADHRPGRRRHAGRGVAARHRQQQRRGPGRLARAGRVRPERQGVAGGPQQGV
ncbi:MAG: glycosyltransferase, partial [Mycobacteriaceae bacterium]|nr:glycosyltransferase [Mycobacteriaceae bacterium]